MSKFKTRRWFENCPLLNKLTMVVVLSIKRPSFHDGITRINHNCCSFASKGRSTPSQKTSWHSFQNKKVQHLAVYLLSHSKPVDQLWNTKMKRGKRGEIRGERRSDHYHNSQFGCVNPVTLSPTQKKLPR